MKNKKIMLGFVFLILSINVVYGVQILNNVEFFVTGSQTTLKIVTETNVSSVSYDTNCINLTGFITENPIVRGGVEIYTARNNSVNISLCDSNTYYICEQNSCGQYFPVSDGIGGGGGGTTTSKKTVNETIQHSCDSYANTFNNCFYWDGELCVMGCSEGYDCKDKQCIEKLGTQNFLSKAWNALLNFLKIPKQTLTVVSEETSEKTQEKPLVEGEMIQLELGPKPIQINWQTALIITLIGIGLIFIIKQGWLNPIIAPLNSLVRLMIQFRLLVGALLILLLLYLWMKYFK